MNKTFNKPSLPEAETILKIAAYLWSVVIGITWFQCFAVNLVKAVLLFTVYIQQAVEYLVYVACYGSFFLLYRDVLNKYCTRDQRVLHYTVAGLSTISLLIYSSL